MLAPAHSIEHEAGITFPKKAHEHFARRICLTRIRLLIATTSGFLPILACADTDGDIAYNSLGAPVTPMWSIPMPLNANRTGYPLPSEAEHFNVWQSTPENGAFNHHAALAWHNGLFYAMWSNHPQGEDAPGQRVLYAYSSNSETWSQPIELFPPPDTVKNRGKDGLSLRPDRWIILDNTLYAVVSNRGTGVAMTLIARSVSENGTLGHPVTLRQVSEEHHLPVYMRPFFATAYDPLLSPRLRQYYTDRHIVHWWGQSDGSTPRRAVDNSNLIEPFTYLAADGNPVLLMRSHSSAAAVESGAPIQNNRLYVSFRDEQDNWTSPLPTDIPNSPSRSEALALPDGSILLIGNQLAYRFDSARSLYMPRHSITLALSRDGYRYTQAFDLRRDAPTQYRSPGIEGRTLGYAYTSSLILGDTLYTLYSVGKEDIAISRLPLSAIKPHATIVNDAFWDGNRSNQKLPNSLKWFGSSSSHIGIADKDSSGHSLKLSANSSVPRHAVAYFAPEDRPVSLNTGDSAVLSFKFTPLKKSSNTALGLRLGLLLSGVNRVSADASPSVIASGYAAFINPVSAAGSIRKRNDNNLAIIASVNAWDALPGTSEGNEFPLSANNAYIVSLEIKRDSEDSASLRYSVTDGNHTYTHFSTDNLSPETRFDTIAIAIHENIGEGLVDDVSLVLRQNPQRTKILFVGNSYTYGYKTPVSTFNNGEITDLNPTSSHGGIPGIFKQLCKEAGISDVDVHIEAVGEESLEYHFQEKSDLITSQPWDIAILQDDGSRPLQEISPNGHEIPASNIPSFNQAVTNLAALLRVKNPSVKIYLYETWGRPDFVTNGRYNHINEMQAQLRKSFVTAVQANHLDGYVPVGSAFINAINSGYAYYDPKSVTGAIDLYANDRHHPGTEGSYLSALVFLTYLCGVDPRILPCGGGSSAESLGISSENARVLQLIASRANPSLLSSEELLSFALTKDALCDSKGSLDHLPSVSLGDNGILSISFTPWRLGVSYEVQQSSDLQDWISIRTITTPLDEEISVNTTVSPSETHGCFLRLKVSADTSSPLLPANL